MCGDFTNRAYFRSKVGRKIREESTFARKVGANYHPKRIIIARKFMLTKTMAKAKILPTFFQIIFGENKNSLYFVEKPCYSRIYSKFTLITFAQYCMHQVYWPLFQSNFKCIYSFTAHKLHVCSSIFHLSLKYFLFKYCRYHLPQASQTSARRWIILLTASIHTFTYISTGQPVNYVTLIK